MSERKAKQRRQAIRAETQHGQRTSKGYTAREVRRAWTTSNASHCVMAQAQYDEFHRLFALRPPVAAAESVAEGSTP